MNNKYYLVIIAMYFLPLPGMKRTFDQMSQPQNILSLKELCINLILADEATYLPLMENLSEKKQAELSKCFTQRRLYAALSQDKLDLEEIMQLIKQGANPNTVGKFGTTALSIACSANDIQTMEQLFTFGANIYYTKKSLSLLSQACLKGNADMVKLLLANSANPNEKDKYGIMTPFAYAGDNEEIQQILLDAGAQMPEPSSDIILPM
jgi:ankyrin repeat protein